MRQLQANAKLFLELANSAGLNTGMAQGTAIIPIITGDENEDEANRKALQLSEALFNNGINAQPILYPAVEKEGTRVRIFMTAIHTEQQIRDSVEVIAREWKKIESGSPSITSSSSHNGNGAHNTKTSASPTNSATE